MIRNKSKIAYFIYFTLLFLAAGYINCDALYYKNIVIENNLKTPEDAFFYVIKTAKRFDSTDEFINGLPMRDKIEQHRGFSCDEGAIFLGKLLDYSSHKYSYHLTDIFGMDEMSHHTVLQVFENNIWKTYDIIPLHSDHKPHFNGNLSDCVDYQIKYLSHHEWTITQKIYQFLLEHNTFLKWIFLKIRKIG
jgi:hypothetical protein